jgi:hypothetical protein
MREAARVLALSTCKPGHFGPGYSYAFHHE